MAELPFHDRTDFDDADRGLIAELDPGVITNEAGRVVWDVDAYDFLDADCPDTAHPSLWRQGQLCARQGLFEVVPGLFQIRGFDLSNMTLVEGDEGVIVIDPLISTESAAAGLALYREHRGHRPVSAVIYTHSHIDHFGGVRGVVTEEVPILAPVGFLEHAVAENVYAGTAMSRRAQLMYASELEKGPAGQIGAGLGQTTSAGSISLLPPTVDIGHTGAGGRARRGAHRVPDDAGHRGTGRDELPVPRPVGPVHGRERHPQPAQPADAARGAGARPAEPGRATWARPSTCSPTAPTWPSPRTTGRPGAATAW